MQEIERKFYQFSCKQQQSQVMKYTVISIMKSEQNQVSL